MKAGSRRGRKALDRRLSRWQALGSARSRPAGGWIRATRDALGMSADELATRMGVTQSAISKLESSERSGRIRLESLDRAAQAMGCDVVYALVPRTSLEDTVMTRARALAEEEFADVSHTMALEAQRVGGERRRELVEDLAHRLADEPGLWRGRA